MPENDDSHESEYVDPLIGTMVGRYRVERGIGQGGMGAVYELLQPAIHKRMALKLLHEEYADRPEIVRRFFDEARAVNLIGHPNIVDITDFSHLPDGRPFILMEFLDGQSLEDYLQKQGPLNAEEAVAILRQLCSALGAAHAKGIVHRDLKPENIFITRHPDGTMHIKVLDFGIAKLRASPRDPAMNTRTGVVLGTPTYMSPEQAEGNTQGADHRTDIYSLGAIIYQMLAGAPPFGGKTFAELILKHIHHAPPALCETRHDLAPAWGAIVAKALAKEPAQRFQSMTALYEAAVAALERTPPPPPEDDPAELQELMRVHKRRPRWLLLLATVLGGGMLFLLMGRGTQHDTKADDVSGPTLVATQSAQAIPARALDAAPTRAAAAPVDAGHGDAGPEDAGHGHTSPKSAGHGTLRVSADPWATVYMDGRELGQTPLEKAIAAGRHKIRLKNGSTGQNKSYRILLKKGATETIRERW